MVFLIIGVIIILVSLCLLKNIQIGFAMVIALDLLLVREVTFLWIPLRELLMIITWYFFLFHATKRKEYKLSFSGVYTKPFIFFFIGLIVILYGSSGEGDTSYQFKHIFGLVYYFSYAYIAWIIYHNKEGITQFTQIIAITVLFMTVYGVFGYLTTSNIYLSILEDYTGKAIIGGLTEVRGGLNGRVQSTMSHPLTWGGCCCLLIFFFWDKKEMISKQLKNILMVLLGINTFLTGSRSVFIAFCAGLFFYFLQKEKKIKTLLTIVGIALIAIVAINMIPSLQSFRGLVESSLFFWDDDIANQSEIQGSSVSMREWQLAGVWDLIHDNMTFGLGHGYVDYYYSNYGPHPVLIGFESLIFNKLVEGGILGFLLWLYFFWVLYTRIGKIKNQLHTKQDISLVRSYVVFYLMYALLTGFMQTFLCFIVVYVILTKSLIINDKIESETLSHL